MNTQPDFNCRVSPMTCRYLSWKDTQIWKLDSCQLGHQNLKGCFCFSGWRFFPHVVNSVGLCISFNSVSSLLIKQITHRINYIASQILRTATDGCHSQPWLACRLASRASYWRCSRTLTPLFQFSFRVDVHEHRRTFAKRKH